MDKIKISDVYTDPERMDYKLIGTEVFFPLGDDCYMSIIYYTDSVVYIEKTKDKGDVWHNRNWEGEPIPSLLDIIFKEKKKKMRNILLTEDECNELNTFLEAHGKEIESYEKKFVSYGCKKSFNEALQKLWNPPRVEV